MRHMFHALQGTSDQRQLSRRLWLLAALLLMLAACDAGVTTTGYEPLPPTNMPPLTGTAPAPTEPPPSILPDTQSILLPRGPLEAGTYVSVYMAPSFEFTIPEGFALKDEETDLVYLTKGPDQFPPDFAIFRVANQGVVEMLAELPTLQVSRATNLTYPLGAGQSIDIEAAAADATDITIARTADTDITIVLAAGTRGRVFEFDLDGAVMIVMFSAPANYSHRYPAAANAIAASIELVAP